MAKTTKKSPKKEKKDLEEARQATRDTRNEARVKEVEIENVDSSDYPFNYYDLLSEDAWDFEKFAENFRVKIIKLEDRQLEFDLIGINPAIANAFRRILLAEIPTIAIEKVEIQNNTSLFQDDFLSHRLGLIPLYVDPELFNFPEDYDEPLAVHDETKEDAIAFELVFKCQQEKSGRGDALNVINRNVLSEHLIWTPLNDEQAERFKDDRPRPVEDDILIAKLAPGQELDLRLICTKGIGRDHAKFSPVCTASYRLLPKIELLRDFKGEDARLVQQSFSKGVIEIDQHGKAYVADARSDMCSRNIFRHEHLNVVDFPLR